MFQINSNNIFDTKTGIFYRLSETTDYNSDPDKNGKRKTVPCVSVSSVHNPSDDSGLFFEKDDAVRFWQWLESNVE